MSLITLIEGVHKLITKTDGSPLLENKSFLILNMKDNTIFDIADSPEVRKFFNLLPDNIANNTDNIAENIDKNCYHKDSSQDDAATSAVETTDDLLSDKNGDCATWERSAVMLLFSLRKEHTDLFKNDKVRKEIVWKKIAESFKEKGYKYTAKQIENKWKNLRKNYMKVKDNNNKSGAPLKKCKYYDEMEEVYGKSPSVQPVAVASNLSQKNMFPSTDEEDKDEDICTDIIPIKKSKIDKQLEMWTKYLDENVQKREEARERRHQEKIEQQKQALETYKEVMDKLLKKL